MITLKARRTMDTNPFKVMLLLLMRALKPRDLMEADQMMAIILMNEVLMTNIIVIGTLTMLMMKMRQTTKMLAQPCTNILTNWEVRLKRQ